MHVAFCTLSICMELSHIIFGRRSNGLSPSGFRSPSHLPPPGVFLVAERFFSLNEFSLQHQCGTRICLLLLQIRGNIAQATLSPQLGHIPYWHHRSQYTCSPSLGTLSKAGRHSSAAMTSACHVTLPKMAKANQCMVFTVSVFTVS